MGNERTVPDALSVNEFPWRKFTMRNEEEGL